MEKNSELYENCDASNASDNEDVGSKLMIDEGREVSDSELHSQKEHCSFTEKERLEENQGSDAGTSIKKFLEKDNSLVIRESNALHTDKILFDDVKVPGADENGKRNNLVFVKIVKKEEANKDILLSNNGDSNQNLINTERETVKNEDPHQSNVLINRETDDRISNKLIESKKPELIWPGKSEDNGSAGLDEVKEIDCKRKLSDLNDLTQHCIIQNTAKTESKLKNEDLSENVGQQTFPARVPGIKNNRKHVYMGNPRKVIRKNLFRSKYGKLRYLKSRFNSSKFDSYNYAEKTMKSSSKNRNGICKGIGPPKSYDYEKAVSSAEASDVRNLSENKADASRPLNETLTLDDKKSSVKYKINFLGESFESNHIPEPSIEDFQAFDELDRSDPRSTKRGSPSHEINICKYITDLNNPETINAVAEKLREVIRDLKKKHREENGCVPGTSLGKLSFYLIPKKKSSKLSPVKRKTQNHRLDTVKKVCSESKSALQMLDELSPVSCVSSGGDLDDDASYPSSSPSDLSPPSSCPPNNSGHLDLLVQAASISGSDQKLIQEKMQKRIEDMRELRRLKIIRNSQQKFDIPVEGNVELAGEVVDDEMKYAPTADSAKDNT